MYYIVVIVATIVIVPLLITLKNKKLAGTADAEPVSEKWPDASRKTLWTLYNRKGAYTLQSRLELLEKMYPDSGVPKNVDPQLRLLLHEEMHLDTTQMPEPDLY